MKEDITVYMILINEREQQMSECNCIIGYVRIDEVNVRDGFVTEEEANLMEDRIQLDFQFKHCPCCSKNLATHRNCAVLECKNNSNG